jgi:hypothetical protein
MTSKRGSQPSISVASVHFLPEMWPVDSCSQPVTCQGRLKLSQSGRAEPRTENLLKEISNQEIMSHDLPQLPEQVGKMDGL